MTIFNPVDLSGSVSLGGNPAAGTDPGKITFAEFFDWITKDIVLAIGGSAVASVDLGFDLPLGAMVLGGWLNIQTAITGAGGGTAIGLGITGDEAKYGKTATLVLDAKSTKAIGGMLALGTSEDLKIFATDGSGVATGTIQNGSVRVRLLHAIPVDLPNA